jgi:alpha-glucoside transport system substrate-binding protein
MVVHEVWRAIVAGTPYRAGDRGVADVEEETVDQSRLRLGRLSAVGVALLMVATACGEAAPGTPAPGTPDPGEQPTPAPGGTLNVLSLWGGSEEEAFRAVLDHFQETSGITVNYEGVREDYATVLQARLTAGNPPDIAIIPGIGFLRRFALDGSLIPVQDLGVQTENLGETYPQGFLDAGTVDGTLYALPAKYNSKATVWYRPDLFADAGAEVPTDWQGLLSTTEALRGNPDAHGLGAADDWTLTDWFEIIYLNEAGPEAYDRLFGPEGDWTDPSVQSAVDRMLEILTEQNIAGSIDAALGRGFVDGIAQVFGPSPEAAMYYEGGFVGGIAMDQVNPDLVIGETIDWFPFPRITADADYATFGGDVVGAFTDSDTSRAFMQYIITQEANEVWAGTGAIVSPHRGVGTEAYPNELVVREAEQLANADEIRFDGSDLLPAGISGENLGPTLQRALRGESIDWADFSQRVQAAWQAE